ncbi:MAG: hypothetical protein JJT75_09845 [Opitutales bacterium]|nr:hypothetical protein [Opitutales bacterium]
MINEYTPIRATVTHGPDILKNEHGEVHFDEGRRAPGPLAPVPRDPRLPEFGWTAADFDDFHWAQYEQGELADFLGGYGGESMRGTGRWLTTISLRTLFGIENPSRVQNLQLEVVALGGAVIYVNGEEVGRGYMPEGDIHELTTALPYPEEAYVDGRGRPLPKVSIGDEPEMAKEHYEKRVRTFTVDIPNSVLNEGVNVLAVDLRRAPRTGEIDDQWDHVGFHQMSLTASRAGVIPYEEAMQGTHAKVVAAEQQTTDAWPEGSLVRGESWFWTLYASRGKPVKGVFFPNPFEPERSMKMASPRGGFDAGQVQVANLDGVENLSAQLRDDFVMENGTRMSADRASIFYARSRPSTHHADVLKETPPEGAKAVPVWLTVEVPAEQEPGLYRTTLEIQANRETFSIPVQLVVSDYQIPEPKDFDYPEVTLTQDPKTVALYYDVDMWSEEHWDLMERSFYWMSKVGNVTVEAPVILSNFPEAARAGRQPSRTSNQKEWYEPLVIFEEQGGVLRANFEILERYLDLHEKYLGEPKVVSFWIWDPGVADELADGYEGQQRPAREASRSNFPEVKVRSGSGNFSHEEVPTFTSDGADEFWSAFFSDVQEFILSRGYSDEAIAFGLGSDVRPSENTAKVLEEWGTWIRWDLLSHFSGDPGSQFHSDPAAPEEGRQLVTGGHEAAVKRWPYFSNHNYWDAKRMEEEIGITYHHVQAATARWHHQPFSAPNHFRSLPLFWKHIGHFGVDFWLGEDDEGPTSTSFFTHVDEFLAPGERGAVPTTQFFLFRKGVQEGYLRMRIVDLYLQNREEDERQPYRDLLDELTELYSIFHSYLAQSENRFNYPRYHWRLLQAIAELTGGAEVAEWVPDEIDIAAAGVEPMRTWTNQEGDQIKAAYRGLRNNRILLKREDGQIFEVDPNIFSEEDQDYIREILGLD